MEASAQVADYTLIFINYSVTNLKWPIKDETCFVIDQGFKQTYGWKCTFEP